MKVIDNRNRFFSVSLVIILVGFAVMIFNAQAGRGMLNWDVDFTGGTSMEIDMGGEYDYDGLYTMIQSTTGQSGPQIQRIIGTNSVAVKLQSLDGDMRMNFAQALQAQYPAAEIISVADVSGTVSKEMQKTAIQATVIACLVMLVYISVRFRGLYAGGSAIIALIHDILVVTVAYAILRIPVNNTFIAVVLTILGYSINATIVIFDRIRENKELLPELSLKDRINKSLAQTLARSINTSVTTLLAVGAIYAFGVQSIKEFALPMMIGIIVGAYSSVCISASVWYSILPKKERE